MTLRIHVIGLGRQRPVSAYADLFKSCPVIARDGELAEAWLTPEHKLTESFDDLFDSSPPEMILSEIIERFNDAAHTSEDCVYLVPECGHLGDATVAALESRFELRMSPGLIEAVRPLGTAQIIDSLDLAIAEAAYPFDSGNMTLDATRPIIITNFRGETVTRPARRRISRYVGSTNLEVNASRSIFLTPAEDFGPVRSFSGLQQIVSTLRSPEGCPWDREQTVETLIPMMLEELDEFRESIQSEGATEQADELGDVLLHILFIAQIAREREGGFTMEDVLQASSDKMVRRHPHVFGDVEASSIEEIYEIWQDVKKTERATKADTQSNDRVEG